MHNSFLEGQKKNAQDNFNYFFMIMIVKVIKILIILACILLINQIFDTLVINIITLILTVCSILSIYKIVDDYNYILNDIRNTFKDIDFNFNIDINIIKNYLYKKVEKYGK